MAYGARLESVLGESPRGFESPILRQEQPGDAHSAHPGFESPILRQETPGDAATSSLEPGQVRIELVIDNVADPSDDEFMIPGPRRPPDADASRAPRLSLVSDPAGAREPPG